MKKLYILLAVAMVAFNAMAQDELSAWNGKCKVWTRGEGTQESPFLIESAENLAFLSFLCAQGFETRDMYFKLTTDIDLNGSEIMPWNPIGAATYYDYQSGCIVGNDIPSCFRGHFDGDGHGIFNLYTNIEDGGLFGHLNGMPDNLVVVENLNIMSGVVNGDSSGALSDKVSYGIIRRCANKANVIGENSGGGLLGTALNSTIMECYNEGCVKATEVGGIAGRVQKSTIENCYNVAGLGGYDVVGGIVGNSYKNVIKNCYNAGDIVCDGSSAGALVAVPASNDVIDNSYYINTCGAAGVGVSKTPEEMRDRIFVNELNLDTDVWGYDEDFENQGFPVLKAGTTDVNEIADSELLVYPNPAQYSLTVECADAVSVAVYDVLGQCVHQVEVSSAKTDISVSDLESGVYILSVSCNNRQPIVTRFVVTH